MKQLLKVSTADFKLIFRDPSLRIFLFLPALIFLVINIFLPYLISKFEGVNEYVSYVLIVATIENTQMFGFIYSMVLIEEKETEVARVYGVLPVSKMWFVLFRLIIPCLITALLTWAILLIQPFYSLAIMPSLVFSILSGLIVPVYVLGITVLSRNKMQGMIWIKIFNIAVVLPIVAFFVPDSFTHVFGILPSHWAFQGLSDIIDGGSFFVNAIIGFAYFLILLTVAVRKFSKIHFV
ncbi:hypothetical protein QQ020_18305 [Fulvivirgaceae bacterium BMA12]|uniref:ABC transporter permease n=1 Tax=Agaribacillus aureus TaxID=3051825 RepID=A0ABT8L8F4_9BACT|nr:hypothetical protein [Fulvivirgaceae bacterium BMA12]